jgi:hypothetical protein
MSFIAAAIGAGVGIYGANKQAKAQDAATAANLKGFQQYEPYVDAALSGGQGALDGVLATGNYQGPTYAGPNALQQGTANTMGAAGTTMMTSGQNMMANSGNFGQNSQDLYGQYQGMADNAANTDRLGVAQQYARNNSQPLIDAAMRDDARTLTESTLPGINMGASGTGNVNSSRAGVQEALANRGYGDRYADTTGAINQGLMEQSLGQQNTAFNQQGTALNYAGQANNGINSAYNTGVSTLGTGGQFGMNAGNTMQGFDQAGFDDLRNRFANDRDFGLDQYKGYMSGMLGKAPSAPTNTQPNYNDPLMGAVSGGMTGYGFAQDFGKANPKSFFGDQFLTGIS